jgi:hypothetical protein
MITTLATVLLFSCGCATPFIRGIGRQTETLSGRGDILVAEDGGVAMGAKADYRGDARDGKPGKLLYTRTRYVIGSDEVMHNSIATAQKTGITETNAAAWVTCFPVAAEELCRTNWVIVPQMFGDSDCTIDMLPEKFRDGALSIAQGQPFYYEYEGKPYLIHISISETRCKRRWWGYPAQVLLPAAWIYDGAWMGVAIVTAPLWILPVVFRD